MESSFNKNFLRSYVVTVIQQYDSAPLPPLNETYASRWKVETEIIIWCGQYLSCKLNHLEGSIELEIEVSYLAGHILANGQSAHVCDPLSRS